MNYLRNVFTKKQIIWLISSGIALVLFFIILIVGLKLAKSQPAQSAAGRWDSKGESAQISVFYSELASIEEDDIKQLNFAIDSALHKESLLFTDPSVRKRISAYSAQTEATVLSKLGSQIVKVIGVGGDFFQFHPVKLLYGSYFDENDLMQDHILLDSETAWYLFGSSNIVGQTVDINGKLLVVSGVYERESGRLNNLAGNNEKTVFVSYESMKNDLGVSEISCFETIMPEPVNEFAYKTVQDAVSVENNRFEVIDNSKRFNWITLVKDVKGLEVRSMNSKSVIFPYWENMARGLEDKLIPLCLLALFLLLFAVVNIIVLLIRMWINREIRLKNIKEFIEDRIDERRKRKRELKKPEGGEYL